MKKGKAVKRLCLASDGQSANERALIERDDAQLLAFEACPGRAVLVVDQSHRWLGPGLMT